MATLRGIPTRALHFSTRKPRDTIIAPMPPQSVDAKMRTLLVALPLLELELLLLLLLIEVFEPELLEDDPRFTILALRQSFSNCPTCLV